MQTYLSFVKIGIATTLFCGITLAGAGCSRIEKVKVVNHFGQAVRVRINDKNTVPLVPANGETVLDDQFYVGPGVWVTVLSDKGKVLKEKQYTAVPGDSQFRSVAVVEIQP